MYVLTSKGAHLDAIFVRTIDFNQWSIRAGSHFTCPFFNATFLGDIFRHLAVTVINSVRVAS